MKQTAVEWLVDQLLELEYDLRLIPNHIEQAKQIEKEQIIDAFKHGRLPVLFGELTSEKYYNETYRSKGSNEHIEHNLDEIEKSENPINLISSQTEIPDEEIEDASLKRFITDSGILGFIEGAKWYREQLKKRQ